MIVKKFWYSVAQQVVDRSGHKGPALVRREGWFLFGLLPIYIRDTP